MLKIIKNPDKKVFDEVIAEVKSNYVYCPCRLERTPDTKCPCKEFREQTTEGECHCGAYQKVEVSNNE